MAGSDKAFACPKCGQIIEFGANPCQYCGMPIIWEGFEPPEQTEADAGPPADLHSGLSQADVQAMPFPQAEQLQAAPELTLQTRVESVPTVPQTQVSQPLASPEPQITTVNISRSPAAAAAAATAAPANLSAETAAQISAAQLAAAQLAAANATAAAASGSAVQSFDPAARPEPSTVATITPLVETVPGFDPIPAASIIAQPEPTVLPVLPTADAAPTISVASTATPTTEAPIVSANATPTVTAEAVPSVAFASAAVPAVTPAVEHIPATAPAPAPAPATAAATAPAAMPAAATATAPAAMPAAATASAPAAVFTPEAVPAASVPASVPALTTPAPEALTPAPAPAAAPAPAPEALTPALTTTPAPEVLTPAPAPAPATTPALEARPAGTQSVIIPPLPESPRRSRASAGARAISGIFKAIAVIIWIIAAVILAMSINSIVQAGSTTLDSFINQLVNHSSITTVVVGFVVGLAFFGFGVVISLLNDIRRKLR